MAIGNVYAGSQTVLAPLAGITDLPFRRVAKEYGAGLVCSEMISANGLVYGSGKTVKMLDSLPEEKPLSVQIFGSDAVIMAKAAAIVENSGADILDINCGCSVRKILKTGSGSALMKHPETAAAVLKAVRGAVSIPVTIKIRSGWDPSGIQALEISRMAQDCGVDAVAVHPRTATQGFRGNADWSIIREVKKAVGIPVIGNGDISEPQDALDMLEATGCDAVMIGRAAIANPWIFGQINALVEGRLPAPVGLERKFDMMLVYLHGAVQYYGETHACRIMRSRLGWFVKGMRYSSRFRESIKRISNQAEAEALIINYRRQMIA